MRPLLRATILPLLCLAFACGDAADLGEGGTGGSGGSDLPPGYQLRPGAPLASAGADQRVLEGLPVRLDGRASRRGEQGLPIRYLWVQEEGPRVVLDDPASPEPWFVAPPIRPGEGRSLVFRLSVDDGERRSHDRVTVELVGRPEQMTAAPTARAGADLEVRPGEEVELGVPLTLDPACVEEGGSRGCEHDPIEAGFTQIEGPPVDLEEGRFVAPAFDALLTFRLDAHRRTPAGPQLAACGPEGTPAPGLLCSAPDFVRVIVRNGARLGTPSAKLVAPAELAGRTELLRIGPGLAPGEYPWEVRLSGEARGAPNFGYLPLVGDVPPGPLDFTSTAFHLPRTLRAPDGGERPGWPRTVAVTFEAQAGRLRSAPAVAAVAWEWPQGGRAPAADAGANPCAPGATCVPFVGGETVVLEGSVSAGFDLQADELTWCWEQTFGPPVRFEEEGTCLRGEPRRTFQAPEAPPGGRPIHLAFVLTVGDGGPLVSRPDTAVVFVRPRDNEPPVLVVELPDEVDEGATVRLDASGSWDPEGEPLHFAWQQLPTGAPAATLLQVEGGCNAPADSGACVDLVAPLVTADTDLHFELSVADRSGLAATLPFRIVVRNSQNDPPDVDAGPDRVVAQGVPVEVAGSASDPNPGDQERLVYRWRVLEGDVALEEADAPVARFTVPRGLRDVDLVLELEVTDPHGGVGRDQVAVSAVAAGPYVSPGGDDAAPGSRHAPVATLARAVDVARAAGLGSVRLDLGAYEPEGLELDGVLLVGGHDASRDWEPGAGESRLLVRQPVVLRGGGGLERLAIGAADSVGGALVEVRGMALLRDVDVDASALLAPAAAVRVEGGELLVERARLAGPGTRAASDEAQGIACAAGSLTLLDTAVDGGAGAGTHVALALGAGCSGSFERATLVGGSAGVEAVGLSSGPGALLVRGSTIRGGEAPVAVGARLGGGTLRETTITGGAGGEAVGLEVRGMVALERIEAIRGAAGVALHGTGIRVEAGGSLVADRLLLVEGGAAALSSRGVEVAPGGSVALANTLVFAGGAPEAEALRGAGTVWLHSSLLRVRPGGGTTRASALALTGGEAELRNLILDAGGTAADRAQLRLEGAHPAVLLRVLFAADAGCGGGAALVRESTAACTRAAIESLDSSWEPLVGDPGFLDPAAGDYRLRQESPAVDAGTDEGAPAWDVGGLPRGGDGNGDGIEGVDIGPWER